MLFPISDENPGKTSAPWITYLLIALNTLLYLYQNSHPEFTAGWSAVPYEITHGQDIINSHLAASPSPLKLTLLSSMFMHGGIMHLVGNMLYLYIFGDNLERRFGRILFLTFYLISGIVAAYAHILLAPDSTVPMVGASGAISGVMGAYIVLFPWNRVNAVLLYQMVSLPAVAVLGLWIAMQVFQSMGSLAHAGETGGVAYAAHIGGFIAGVVTGIIARMMIHEEPDSVTKRFSAAHPSSRRMW